MITTKEVMKYLGVSRQMVSKLRKQGLPHSKVGYKTVRYDLEKVKEWLEDKK